MHNVLLMNGLTKPSSPGIISIAPTGHTLSHAAHPVQNLSESSISFNKKFSSFLYSTIVHSLSNTIRFYNHPKSKKYSHAKLYLKLGNSPIFILLLNFHNLLFVFLNLSISSFRYGYIFRKSVKLKPK
jgi:hypothetical protein